jgi:hypothetical protein
MLRISGCATCSGEKIADVDEPGQQRVAGRAAELQRAHEIRQCESLSGVVRNEIEYGCHTPDAW